MTTLRHNAANETKVAQVSVALEALLREVMQRGYFGTASVEVAVQDGTIQHVRRRLERLEK